MTRDSGGLNAQTTFQYNPGSAAPTQIQYPNGQQIHYTYDDWGRLLKSASSDTGTTVTNYDARDRVTQRLEPDATRTVYTYDRAARAVKIDYDADHPGAMADDVRNYYDAVPSTLTCPSAGRCTSLAGRLAVSETDSTAPTYRTYYGYTAAGETNYESVPNMFGTGVIELEYVYDAAGRLTALTRPYENDTVAYQYNLSDQSADAESVVSFSYQRGTGLVVWYVDRVERYPAGPIRSIWYNEHGTNPRPSSPSVDRVRGTDGRVSIAFFRTALADLGQFQYSYDTRARITSIVQTGGSATSDYYQYDALDRLTCDTATSGASCTTWSSNLLGSYNYDTTSNRTSWSGLGDSHSHTYSYPAGSSRAASWTRSDWTHPNNVAWGTGVYGGGAPGQRIGDTWTNNAGTLTAAHTFSYWPTGEINSLSVSDGRTGGGATFTSGNDARRRRIFAHRANPDGSWTSTQFIYDTSDHLRAVHGVTSAGVATDQEFEWLDDEPAVRTAWSSTTAQSQVAWYNDHLGTPRIGLAFDPIKPTTTTSVVYRAPREPFMASAPATQDATYPVELRFPGQWYDEGTAMYSSNGVLADGAMLDLIGNRAREYDPGVGAYSSNDPLLAELAFPPASDTVAVARPAASLFAYVDGNPVASIDPTGESAIDCGHEPAGRCHCYCRNPDNSETHFRSSSCDICPRYCGDRRYRCECD